MSNFQFAFIVMLIFNIAMNQLFDEYRNAAPNSRWGERMIAASAVMIVNLFIAFIGATIYAALI